jgi:hypothetical protein
VQAALDDLRDLPGVDFGGRKKCAQGTLEQPALSLPNFTKYSEGRNAPAPSEHSGHFLADVSALVELLVEVLFERHERGLDWVRRIPKSGAPPVHALIARESQGEVAVKNSDLPRHSGRQELVDVSF